MYRVVVMEDGKEYPLHEPRDTEGELQLIEPVVTLEMGKIGSFVFQIVSTHPNRSKIKVMKSEIIVYSDQEILFAGRAIAVEGDFYNMERLTCEGELGYLVDSIQRPFEFTGNGMEFFKRVVASHNSQVDAWKRLEVGNVTVADTEAESLRVGTSCTTTLKALKSQLVERNGGFLRVRRAGGKKYLDYVSDYGGINSQVIRFGENLLDLTSYIKPTSIITALIPYGASVESEDPDDEKPLDITSVNDGVDYLYDPGAVAVYGWIWGTHTFDDVTDAEALLAKGKAYLQECTALPETLELKAMDLSLMDFDVQELRAGYWTQVESVPHKISKRFLLSKKIIHLDDPGRDEVVLGATRVTFTASVNKDQAQITKRIDRVASSTSKEINRKIDNATQLITGGKGGYVVLDVLDPDTGEKMHPWRILIMNTPDKETATNVIQINQNGIGFSTTGIHGPYANAWTIDGNLVADFITGGTMLADRIRGGNLELGGSGLGRDGRLTVKDAEDREIGYWDKTGLYVYEGAIEGLSFRGGSINIGNGTFTVDRDGSVGIDSGEINIGPVKIRETYADIGAFKLTDSDFGAMVSLDADRSVQIYTVNNVDENGPAIILQGNGYKTRIGCGGTITHDIFLESLEEEYGGEWGYISYNIIELWDRIARLENQ